jgi:hypothetical protein
MRRTAALILATASLLAAGCGEDAKEEYSNDVKEVGQKLQESSVGEQLRNVQTADQLAAALVEAAKLLDDAAADLDELDPPDEVSGAHKKLTEGARETADAFRHVAEKTKSGDRRDVLSTIAEATQSGGVAKLEAGLRELEDKGYDVRDEDEK